MPSVQPVLPPVEERAQKLPALVHVASHLELLSELLGVAPRTVYLVLARGDLGLRPVRVGRRLVVRRAELLAALGIAPSTPPAAPISWPPGGLAPDSQSGATDQDGRTWVGVVPS
jgi:hypothetical protein